MVDSPSTVPNSLYHTVAHDDLEAIEQCARQISLQWEQENCADLVEAVSRHPGLLRQKSVLLNLAIKEYQIQRPSAGEIGLQKYCQRFAGLNSSIRCSIVRQLEVQSYLDHHPDLLNLLAEPDWPGCGESIGPFTILEEIGRGALARVYLGREPAIGNRAVVLKISPVVQFEASILGRLNHPHIIPIYSTGECQERGLHYLCMPYCGRSTLVDLVACAFDRRTAASGSIVDQAAAVWLSDEDLAAIHGPNRNSPLTKGETYVGRIIRLAIQIADALSQAHAQGVVHGDIKPSNVLLSPAGDALLLDFNLSRDLVTSVGLPGGTLPYMAPEQLQPLTTRDSGDSPEVEANVQTDIYSFGALLYELLTGEIPYRASSATASHSQIALELLTQHQESTPPLTFHNAIISSRLQQLIRTCLACDPDDRPPTMAEVAAALRRETGGVAGAQRKIKANPRRWSAILATVAAVAGGVAVAVALQPDPYLAAYQQGLANAADGRLNDAIEQFETSLASQPEFRDARFELARALLHSGESDKALPLFRGLAVEQPDSQVMAYIGYCFNAHGTPVAAIPWYEKALAAGLESTHAQSAVYNNLAASYLSSNNGFARKEQLQKASSHMSAAKELNAENPVVQLNLLRLKLELLEYTGERVPRSLVPAIEQLCEELPENPMTWLVASTAYRDLQSSDRRYVAKSKQALKMANSLGGAALVELGAGAAEHHPPTTEFTDIKGFGRSQGNSKTDRGTPMQRTAWLYIEPGEQ